MRFDSVRGLGEKDLQVLKSALQEVEGRIAVVRSDIINYEKGLVFRSDMAQQRIEDELEALKEDRETLKSDIRKLSVYLGLGGAQYVHTSYGGA